MSETRQFNTGAVRSADADGLDFMSISPIAMVALARTCQEGGTKYGYHNWELGMDTIDILNHVHRHLQLWQAGDRSEPHLPHALWGIHAAVHMDTLHPELSVARRRGPGCSVTPAMAAHLEANKAGLAEKRKSGFFATLGGWAMDGLAEIRQILDLRRFGHRVDLPAGHHTGSLRRSLQEAFHEGGVTDLDIYGPEAGPPTSTLVEFPVDLDEDDDMRDSGTGAPSPTLPSAPRPRVEVVADASVRFTFSDEASCEVVRGEDVLGALFPPEAVQKEADERYNRDLARAYTLVDANEEYLDDLFVHGPDDFDDDDLDDDDLDDEDEELDKLEIGSLF